MLLTTQMLEYNIKNHPATHPKHKQDSNKCFCGLQTRSSVPSILRKYIMWKFKKQVYYNKMLFYQIHYNESLNKCLQFENTAHFRRFDPKEDMNHLKTHAFKTN